MNRQELYHEIFGSILDRREMTPYLLRNCENYPSAIKKTNLMLANRGFDLIDGELCPLERERVLSYAEQAFTYYTQVLFPSLDRQLQSLAALNSRQRQLYVDTISRLSTIRAVMASRSFLAFIREDPRHLFLLVSCGKYPNLFQGYTEENFIPGKHWCSCACAVLKMCHLIKAVEEDSQDIHDYAQLGMFFESKGQSLTNLASFDWENPPFIPESESARRAFVKLSDFFRKLRESLEYNTARKCMVFKSGDGVDVDIIDLKARLKSPASMFAKLGKDIEGEAFNIRDILALTFLIRRREDSLTLFHALQKRGVILQENTVSTSITQTLFTSPEDMLPAICELAENLARSEGSPEILSRSEIQKNAEDFFASLSVNAVHNPHTSDKHRKFQCKINYSLPVHRKAETGVILVPGTPEWKRRTEFPVRTQQHTLPVEIRISDIKSWEESEQKGEAHHAAYKFRQHLVLMNRLFDPLFVFPKEAFDPLREDQNTLFR